jgi:hypothetical protein
VKRIIVVLVALVLAGCGGGDGPGIPSKEELSTKDTFQSKPAPLKDGKGPKIPR